jgi:hypothetical protein
MEGEDDLEISKSLLDSLRDGGFIFYVRHGEATVGEDRPNLNFQNCYTQRNLSEMGRNQAIYYGEILRYMRIPISYPVITSPFCRTIETAQLAFGSGNVKADPFWVEIYKLSGNLVSEERKRTLDNLQSLLEIQPEEGRNKVIIAHSFPKGIGLGQISDMETIVVKPLGQGKGFKEIARLSLADLYDLWRFGV